MPATALPCRPDRPGSAEVVGELVEAVNVADLDEAEAAFDEVEVEVVFIEVPVFDSFKTSDVTLAITLDMEDTKTSISRALLV
jgi:hypothetical protein